VLVERGGGLRGYSGGVLDGVGGMFDTPVFYSWSSYVRATLYTGIFLSPDQILLPFTNVPL
jgi:hypothetical protein